MADSFDPRQATLAHAEMASWLGGHPGDRPDGEVVIGELANVVACGLVYVGDQIRLLQQVDAGPELSRMVQALERIRDHEEHFGSFPADDEMREIAREALQGDSPKADVQTPTFRPEIRVRARSAATLEVDGQVHMLLPGDVLTIPTTVVMS